MWFNMVWTDSRSSWSSSLLRDPRVMHYWDATKDIGRWYAQNETDGGEGDRVEWDAWFLYDRSAEWSGNQAPSLVGWGRTIMGSRGDLEKDLLALSRSGHDQE